MPDPRIEEYARVLVETCVDVQPDWQSRRLQSAGEAAHRGDVAPDRPPRGIRALAGEPRRRDHGLPWTEEASEELLGKPASIRIHELETADALIAIVAPENTRELTAVSPERMGLLQTAYRPALERMFTVTCAGSAAITPHPPLHRTPACR